MKAVLLTGHGGLDKLVYVDDYHVPGPGPGEVTIDVAACGMNNTDVWVREAAYGTEDNPSQVIVAPWSQHTHFSPHTGL